MKTSDQLYESAVERIALAIALRRGQADYCAINDGEFVVDHDTALALAAAQAVGLRELYDALCEARAALAREPSEARLRQAA